MPKLLPARPNLEHLRAQAKALLTSLRGGDSAAVRTFAKHLPEAAGLSPRQIVERGFRLCDAQAVIARKTGFSAWPGLARHVDSLRRMEGTWSFRSLEVDGQAVPQAMVESSHILIDGDRFRTETPEGNYEGIFVIDVEAAPPRIDIEFVEGPEAGNRCEGLFQLDGDELTFCLGLVGSARPQEFKTSPGSGHALEVLVRSDASRPPGVDGGTPMAKEPERLAVAKEQPEPPVHMDSTLFERPMTPTLERLQGEWTALELINSGSPLQASYLPFGLRTQHGAETKVVFGGQTMLHAKVRFHEVSSPIEVDYWNLAGKGKGTVSLGLFRWDGDEAVFCIAAAGEPRPADFGCEKGSKRILSRWKRK